MAGGYTLTFDEKDSSHMPKAKLLDSLAMMLGGRSSEEVMLEDVTTGASNDIERATKLARRMVTEWGMTDKIGLVSFGEGEEVFVGRNYQKQIPYSQELAYTIDQEVKNIIDTAHKQAKEILNSKKDVIEKVVKILIDKETIYKEEFEMLYNGATVEEVEQAIDKKEQEKRDYQEKAKQQALAEHKARDIKARIETAEALAKAGVISKQDFEKIKADAESEMQASKVATAQTTADTTESKPNQPVEEDKPKDSDSSNQGENK